MLAFTLRRSDYRENDQLISFYTKDLGKIELVARGVKKIISKNAPALEPFSLLDIEIVPGKNYSYVTKAFVVENFSKIRSEFEKIKTGTRILKIVENNLKNEEKDLNIFKLIYSFQKFINDADIIPDFLQAAFLGRMMCFLGFTPILSKCSSCGKNRQKRYVFSYSDGGIICEECAVKKEVVSPVVSAKVLQKLKSIFTDRWEKLSGDVFTRDERNIIDECVYGFSDYYLGNKQIKKVI